VRPTAEEMRALLRTLRKRDEKLVAQIHSHPGEAFHSLGDSQHATSYHQGFISIVLPNFGRGVQSLLDCAVYEFRGDFDALTPQEIGERFILQPQIVDLMPPAIDTANTAAKKGGTLWNVLRQKLKSIVSRKQ
jgi:hypothetical protein